MNDESKRAPTLWQVMQSVLWALIGVQKSENYKRDFQHGKPWQYIIIGLIAVFIFIMTIVGVVKLVMSLAGV